VAERKAPPCGRTFLQTAEAVGELAAGLLLLLARLLGALLLLTRLLAALLLLTRFLAGILALLAGLILVLHAHRGSPLLN
jgi:hypothetical protein